MIPDKIEKQWYTLTEFSQITGISINKLRWLVDKNPEYKRTNRHGNRKVHREFVEKLINVKL